jgi:hypothetical protein
MVNPDFGQPTPIGPFYQAAEIAEQVMNEYEESTVFQLFQCSACNHIQRVTEPNTFLEVALCPCGVETNLVQAGCGFVAILGDPEKVIEASVDAEFGKPEGMPS